MRPQHMVHGVLQILQRVQQRPVQVKEHRAHPLFAFVKRRQMRQQNAPQNQHDAHTAQRRHPLAEQYGSENGGKGRTQGAEKARSVGVDAALRHGLQGVAESRAHHRQRRDDPPLAAGLGQPRHFKDKGGDEGIQPQKAHLQHAQREAVCPVAGAVDGDDAHGIEKGRQQGNALAGSRPELPALHGQQRHAAYGHGGAQQAHGLGQPAVDGRFQQRHDDNGQILQQRHRAGVHRPQRQHLAAHHHKKDESHQCAARHRPAIQMPYHFFPEQRRQKHKGQQKPHRQQVKGAHGAQSQFVEYEGGAACDDDRRHQHLRFSL